MAKTTIYTIIKINKFDMDFGVSDHQTSIMESFSSLDDAKKRAAEIAEESFKSWEQAWEPSGLNVIKNSSDDDLIHTVSVEDSDDSETVQILPQELTFKCCIRKRGN